MPSSSSGRSNRSLQSKGTINAAELASAERSSQKKTPAKWMDEEERALVLYLQQQMPGAGDGINFTRKHFNSTAQHLKTKFLVQKGGEKNGATCQTKWVGVRYLCTIYVPSSDLLMEYCS